MIKSSDLTKTYYKTGEVSKILGMSLKTIQRYDERGILEFERTSTNRRLLTRENLIKYLDEHDKFYDDSNSQRQDVIYVRVSSQDQKQKGDLDRQALHIIENVSGLQNPLILKECGSGLNDNRPKLNQLLQKVINNEVNNIYVTYQDRLTRFGYHYIETLCHAHNTQIIAIENDRETKTVEEELTKDMMDLLASFSGKLYGRRSHKNSRKEK